MTGNRSLSTLVIGIDAACISVLNELHAVDAIPNITRLRQSGLSIPLTSQIPPWTPSAWPSMYTGVNPGKHGVYSFLNFDGYDWEVVTADHVREHSVWHLLDRHDMRSVVVNVPVTHPVEEINGAIIPGFIGPEDPECYPAGILGDVRDAIGDYRVYPNYSRDDTQYTDEEKITEYCRLAQMRGDAFRYLAERYDPDFGFLQFQRTDTVFHEFEGNFDLVTRIYQETDDQIGKIIESCSPDRIFIVSDHGIGPYDEYEFRINRFLADQDYLSITTGGSGMPSWNPIRRRFREGQADYTTHEPGLSARLVSKAIHLGLNPSDILEHLERIGLADTVRKYAPSDVVRSSRQQVDFQNSRAYMRARTELGIRINLVGREPAGKVPQAEYEAVRDELIEILSNVTTPDGNPVFESVVTREEYFHGPYTEDAVDVVVIPNEFSYFLSAEPLDDLFGPPTEPWNHKLDGIFIAAGNDLKLNESISSAHLLDVAPTILASLGIPASSRMDGKLIPIVTDTGWIDYPEYTETVASEVVGSDVQERLEHLGYLQ